MKLCERCRTVLKKLNDGTYECIMCKIRQEFVELALKDE